MVSSVAKYNAYHADVKEAQLGILQAHQRGFINQEQAIKQLGISSAEALQSLYEQFDMSWMNDSQNVGQESSVDSGSIADGFVHYWLSQNPPE